MDNAGYALVQRIRVIPNERTCCRCGETFAEGSRCVLCGTDDKGTILKVQPPSVPTISYLREGEWERA